MLKYLRYDLINAKNRFGLSLLLCGISPVIVYVLYQATSLISGNGWADYSSIAKSLTLICAICIVVLTAPVKLYGFVTDKRAGSSFALTPAPVWTKAASMFIISGIVVPVLFSILFFSTDAILSLIPGYGQSIAGMIATTAEEHINGHIPFVLLIIMFSWINNTSLFLLGSIFFKKNKAAKTILAIWVASMILSIISMIFLRDLTLGLNTSIWSLVRWLNGFSDSFLLGITKTGYIVIETLWIAVLYTVAYFRLKNIKY